MNSSHQKTTKISTPPLTRAPTKKGKQQPSKKQQINLIFLMASAPSCNQNNLNNSNNSPTPNHVVRTCTPVFNANGANFAKKMRGG